MGWEQGVGRRKKGPAKILESGTLGISTVNPLSRCAFFPVPFKEQEFPNYSPGSKTYDLAPAQKQLKSTKGKDIKIKGIMGENERIRALAQ